MNMHPTNQPSSPPLKRKIISQNIVKGKKPSGIYQRICAMRRYGKLEKVDVW